MGCCVGREGLRSNAKAEGNGGLGVSNESRPISSEAVWCRGPASAEREGMVEGELSLVLRKAKKEEERE